MEAAGGVGVSAALGSMGDPFVVINLEGEEVQVFAEYHHDFIAGFQVVSAYPRVSLHNDLISVLGGAQTGAEVVFIQGGFAHEAIFLLRCAHGRPPHTLPLHMFARFDGFELPGTLITQPLPFSAQASLTPEGTYQKGDGLCGRGSEGHGREGAC